ncbi:porin [Paraburkholderia lycopersici]|uniref:Outer membrane protein (Porin) n=1 Tax=Paraburkholderia lycopersici TaxID=416944 RepID=A0A1G6GS44_9BURK|nr:porin [Paraburkholderia lycopersici]SDB84741.1 Outer membrane protein (porin) [Paraburkholderia lycopersici]
MKKNLAIAAAVAATFASASYAQSSVTLYGIVDAGFTYTTNVNDNANYALTSGNIQASRWGLRGVEDLGGGLKTIFTLESGFDVMNGQQNGGLFNRQSYVGLTQEQYGTLTFGRQFDSMFDYVGPLTAVGTWGGTYMAHIVDNDDLNGTFSLNNAVKYASPNLAGFQFGGLYAFSNQAGGFAVNRAYSAGMSYAYAGLRLGAAYTQINGVNGNGGGAVQGSPFANTFGAFGTSNRQRNWGAGASYAYGPMIGGVVFTQSRLDDPAGNSVRYNNIEGNFRYNLTPALGIGAMYTYTNVNGSNSVLYANGSNSAHWHQFGLQADYALSKRTDVYLEGVGMWGAGENAVGITQVGFRGNANFSSSKNQGIVTTGIRHRF